MTNKELAERIVQECHRIEHGDSKESKFTYSSDIVRKQNDAVQSILSEYQGEAVYTVVHQDETKNPEKWVTIPILMTVEDCYRWMLTCTNSNELVYLPLYLSAPLKKENDNGR